MAQHLPNREIKKLTPETDFFGHIDKGIAIASFFKGNVNDLSDMNMFALYGKWGSGKSTLMRFIGEELENTEEYKSLYFPAWEFEKDDNLSLSLLHFIVQETVFSNETIINEVLSEASTVLKSAIRALSFEVKGIIKVDGDKFITSLNDDKKEKQKEAASLYNSTKQFKNKFKEAEKEILKTAGTKKLIVFIDDLDRCEPENVLSLISSIKLFFTLSSDIIFFFGCDKEAISKAVQHKYGNIIKADEYLEKVIDASFNMPQEIYIHRLLEHYFPGKTIYNETVGQFSILIEEFLKNIHFTNPRHLKKVLNKFELIRNYKSQAKFPAMQRKLIPNIIMNEFEGDLLETVFTLFFIILFEFHPKTFEETFDIDKKITNYATAFIKSKNDNKGSNPHNNYSLNQGILFIIAQKGLFSNDLLKISLTNLAKLSHIDKKQNSSNYKAENRVLNAFNCTLACFTPSKIEHLDVDFVDFDFTKQFYNSNNSEGDILCIEFCNYLIKRKDWVLKMHSDYKLDGFIEMCKVLL